MRVIAGTARGRRLRVPSVRGLRPTSDRARETLFNVLAPRLGDARVLDVFAGSGALGIEALSRGAATATFVERHRRARAAIAANLKACGLAERARVVVGDWARTMRRLGRAGARFELAFFDPPYSWTDAGRCLAQLQRHGLLAPAGLAVIEHRASTPPEASAVWHRERLLEVGDTAFSLFVCGEESVVA